LKDHFTKPPIDKEKVRLAFEKLKTFSLAGARTGSQLTLVKSAKEIMTDVSKHFSDFAI